MFHNEKVKILARKSDDRKNEQIKNSAMCPNFDHKIWNKKRKKVKKAIAIFCGMGYNMGRKYRHSR